jgi:hypothetical protein
MNSKQLTATLGYFFVTVLVALSDKITPDFKWSDLIQPHIIFPAIVTGLVTVTAYKSNGFHEKADDVTTDSDQDQS